MLLLIRFAFVFLFFACIIAIPFFLLKLNELEKKKKTNKRKEERKNPIPIKTKQAASSESEKEATPKVKELFLLIKTKQEALQMDQKWLSLEAKHHLTETFPKDFQNYKELYHNINNKQSVEEEVLSALSSRMDELKAYEKEIEEKKKVALHRQGYIMETREKNHL